MVDKSRVSTMDPDGMFEGGGLSDDFQGTIEKCRLVPYNYGGKSDYALCAQVLIRPDDPDADGLGADFDHETGLVEKHYSAGSLARHVPSADGDNPIDVESWDGEDPSEVEGVYAYWVGEGDPKPISSSSNWAHFVSCALQSGFPREKVAEGAVDAFEGVHGHFSMIAQKKRSGIADDSGRQRTILVLTEITKGSPKSKPKAATKGKAAAKAKAAASDEADDLESRVEATILEALAESENGLAKKGIAKLLMGAFAGKEKAAAVKTANVAFLSDDDRPWEYDADSGTLTIE